MAGPTENHSGRIAVGVDGSPNSAVALRWAMTQAGLTAYVLLEAATGAQLLVLGCRGHGAFAGMLLGSVSRHCVQYAPCPVLVVPQSFASVEGHDSDVMHGVGHHVEPLRGHVSAQ
jgi:nucleotide-binding universal stress UspA family protein